MNAKKFSIIFPTRERTHLLDGLIRSILRTTKNLNDIEILIAFDEDDASTLKYIEEHELQFAGWVQWFKCKRSKNLSRDYYSMLAKHAKGRWIFVCNDDVEFKTPHWDLIADQVLSKEVGDGPDIIYGAVEDSLGDARATEFNNYTCFPILGKKGVDVLGYVFPDSTPMWGADIWCCFLYDAIGRSVKVPISLQHLCHHNKTREQDHINLRVQVESRMQPYDVHPTQQEIEKLFEAL